MIDKTIGPTILTSFLDEVVSNIQVKNCLYLAVSDFSVFHFSEPSIKTINGLDWADKIQPTEKFDLIFGSFPIGMRPVEYDFRGQKLNKIRQNWVEALKALDFLSEDGTVIFLVEPIFFNSNEGTNIENALNTAGYYLKGIFNAPQGLFQETSITPILIIITKNQSDSVFLAELLDVSQAKTIAKNYISNQNAGDLINGMKVPQKKFQSFHHVKIKQQIEKLETQYKEYKEYALNDLALEINYIRSGGELNEKENSIYIPKIGNSPVVSKLSETTLKHHNYFQVVLNEKALNDYLKAFFRSALGKLILQSLTSGVVIPHLNKKDLEQVVVALPTIENQKQIVITHNKMLLLKQALSELDTELALNPTSSSSILSQLDDMLEAIGNLTDADKVRNLIRQGESKYVEFKETLSLDIKKQTKEKYIEDSALKTIVAFLNTDGGKLLIGVADNGAISGVDIEISKFHRESLDKFLLHWKNLVKIRIGEEFYPFIEYRALNVDQNIILLVECIQSNSPCFLDKNDFYVRTNPATDKLEGSKLVEYVKHHFK
jgi:hypothetical protein